MSSILDCVALALALEVTLVACGQPAPTSVSDALPAPTRPLSPTLVPRLSPTRTPVPADTVAPSPTHTPVAEVTSTPGIGPARLEAAEAHYELGVSLQHEGRLEEAIAEFQEAVRVNPDHSLAYHAMGQAYHRRGELVQAIANYKSAIRMNLQKAAEHRCMLSHDLHNNEGGIGAR